MATSTSTSTSARTSRRRAAPQPDRYHHGALHAALIDATEAILREGGIEAFTLREAARRAGVSHAAPAHHFGDARGLLSACAAAGFDRLADAMQRGVDRAGDDAVDRLRAVGQAYIDFALRNRALFQLMFRRDRLNPDDAELKRAGKRTGDALREVIGALMQAKNMPADERGRRILLAWSLVHGYATLVLEDQCIDPFGLDADHFKAASRMGEDLLRLVMTGLAEPAARA
jgi:AcrR family transcriptional regulator